MTSILELSENEIRELIYHTNKIDIIPSNFPMEYCNYLNSILDKIPLRIRQVLTEFKNNGSPTGFLLIRKIPISEDLDLTPPNNTYHIGENTILAKIQGLLLSFMGEMISYEAEGCGCLYQDVVPTKSMENEQTSLGSNKELEIHTEQAFSKLRPDLLSLACLRSNPEARTYILPVKTINNNINPEEFEMLREPLWKTGVDLSFKLHGEEFLEGDIRGPMAILQKSIVDPFLVFDQDLMTGITESSQQMIQKIIDIYYEHRIFHVLQPGDIIFIDNNRAVHGRSPFMPKYDGFDRFLIRCFGTFDYEKSQYSRNGRMVRAIYS
jgi:L-asparagine oxygenase